MRIPERADRRAGDVLKDRYEIVARLNRSPMSVVHKAWDRHAKRFVAVKVAYDWHEDDSNVERLQREGVALMTLRHPRVLRAFDGGPDGDDAWYVVTDLLEGLALDERLETQRVLPVPEAVRIAAETLEALEAVHDAGLLHRDVKPGNLMLTPQGAVLIDFGLVITVPLRRARRITMDGMAVGTPNYMSPEQCQGSPELDGRSDLYAVGLMLYRMLSGKRALTGDDAYAAQRAHLDDRPTHIALAAPRLRLPKRLEDAVMRSLEKRPRDRFRSAAAMREELLAAFP